MRWRGGGRQLGGIGIHHQHCQIQHPIYHLNYYHIHHLICRERARGEKEKPKERGGRGKEGGGSSRHEGARRSEKKESSEDQKKAAELKDKLKNYLKKAKEAKEAKKKVKK